MNTTFIQRCIVVLLSILCTVPAWADGKITHLSGNISVQKSDGTTLPGTVGAKVNEGDIMITGGNGYARLEMTDGGEIVLRPNSQLKVESYRFHPDKPADDNFVFSMLKGGLRTVTGFIGKRGNKDAYEGKTKTATVGIRGTQYDLRFCQGDCGALADGTYLAVRFGAVRAGNPQGSVDLAAGQVALVPLAKPPVILPRDPGIGFTPPAVIPKLDEKKKQSAAAATSEAATPAQGKPSSDSSEKSSQSDTQGKQDDKQNDKQQDKGSESGEKSESSESSGTKGKSGSETSDPASKSGDSGSESSTGNKEGGGSDSGGKPGSPSGSPNNTSSGASEGSSGNSTTLSNNAAPTLQAAPGAECSIQ